MNGAKCTDTLRLTDGSQPFAHVGGKLCTLEPIVLQWCPIIVIPSLPPLG